LGGKLAGIAFQSLDEAENIGYVIPAPVVQHFLEDVESPPYLGFPDLGLTVQHLESSAHRKLLGLTRSRRGVLVTQVHYGASCWKVLRPGDVVLKVDGRPIASDGTVKLGEGSQVEFQYPSWFAYAGLLFVPLTRGWMETWGEGWRFSAPATLVSLYDHGIRTAQTQEVVILQKVLADKVNQGYHDLQSLRIAKVQGRRVRKLIDLVRAVDATEGEFVVFETPDNQRIVIERKAAIERGEAILRRYGVPADRSLGLRTRRRRW
jgi:hypothetical protein